MEEHLVTVAGVGHREDVRASFAIDDRDVRDPGGVQDRVEDGAVGDLLLRQPPDPRARRAVGGVSPAVLAAQSRVHASVSTLRRICSISSKCDWSQISGGESWMTGSPRSSARQ